MGAPGVRLKLYSDTASSVGTGNPVLYKGYEVGRIEATSFDVERQQVIYDLFIDAPFHDPGDHLDTFLEQQRYLAGRIRHRNRSRCRIT